MHKQAIWFIVVFVFYLLVAGRIISLSPIVPGLQDFASKIVTAHALQTAPPYIFDSFFYHLMDVGEGFVTLLDAVIPLFPSHMRVIWWTPQVISFIFLLPTFIILSFLIIKKPFHGVVGFILFSLWLMSTPLLITKSWDQYVSDHHLDIKLPLTPKYIWMRDGVAKSNAYVLYSYAWKQKNDPTVAKISLSCLGHYQLSVNGRRVYHGPVFGVLPTVYADELNIQKYLKKGSNTIDVVCIQINGATHEYQDYETPGILIGGAIADGLFAHNLVDNRLWRYKVMQTVSPGERIFDAGYKELYDLTKKDNASYIPERFSPKYKVVTRPIAQLKYQSVNVTKITSDTYDLGVFTTGYLSIQSAQSVQCKADIIYGVSLGKDAIYMGQKDSVVIPAGHIKWEQISRRSSRYITLKGNCDTNSLTVVFTKVYSNFTIPKLAITSQTTSEDKRIFALAENALRNNIQDHIEDSVDRERAVYLGDAVAVSRCLLISKDNAPLIKQAIKQFAESQYDDGSFPSMSPSGLKQFIPAYSLQWAELLRSYVLATQDNDFAREMWPNLEREIAWANSQESDTGFFNNKYQNKNWWEFFDWTPTSHNFAYQTYNQFWYLRSLETAEMIGKMLDKKTELYHDRKESLSVRILDRAFDKEKGVFVDSFDDYHRDGVSLVTNALAGSLGVFPTRDMSKKALSYFSNDFNTQSPYSESWVVDWMLSLGQKDLALQTIRNYWGDMLRDGATSVYEVYKPGQLLPDEANQSYSHAWGCSPVYQYKEIFENSY